MAIFDNHRLVIMLACVAVAVVLIAVGVIVVQVNWQRHTETAAVETKRRNAREMGKQLITSGVALALVLGLLYVTIPFIDRLVEG